jgi:hypothetical protein
MTLPALACTDGVLPLALLPIETRPDAGAPAQAGSGDGDGSGGTGKSGGRAGTGGLFGEPHAGSGAMPRLPQRCDGYWEPDQEDALREAFNDAISNGHVCPHESMGLTRRLVQDTDLQIQAHGTICFSFTPPPGGAWSPYPGTALGWVISGTPNLEDAKKALLEGDSRSALCDAAKNMTYRAVGVGHRGDWWSVVISPGTPDDMRRDDMQKP